MSTHEAGLWFISAVCIRQHTVPRCEGMGVGLTILPCLFAIFVVLRAYARRIFPGVAMSRLPFVVLVSMALWLSRDYYMCFIQAARESFASRKLGPRLGTAHRNPPPAFHNRNDDFISQRQTCNSHQHHGTLPKHTENEYSGLDSNSAVPFATIPSKQSLTESMHSRKPRPRAMAAKKPATPCASYASRNSSSTSPSASLVTG